MIKLHEPSFGEEEVEAVSAVLRSGQVTSGQKVREFEERLGAGEGEGWGAAVCNSGSSANLLAVAALVAQGRWREGDEVIVSALSWPTTVWPLVQHKLIPVIVDCSLTDLNIIPGLVERAVSARTVGCMPVAVYGAPVDVTAIADVLPPTAAIVEDCCEAFRVESAREKVVARTYSFYFSHHITTVEGGAVLSPDETYMDVLRSLRAHGWLRDCSQTWKDLHLTRSLRAGLDPRFTFVMDGYNLRLTEMQAAMGLCQLDKADAFQATRNTAAHLYGGWFRGSVLRRWFMHVGVDTPSRWFGWPVIIRPDAPFTYKDLSQHLTARGIEHRPLIAGNMAAQPGMARFAHRVCGRLPNADLIMRQGMALPLNHGTTADDVSDVCLAIEDFIRVRGYD